MQTVTNTNDTHHGRSTAARPAPVSRAAATLVALGSVVAGKAMIALGVRRAPEGWRRTVGILLRSESTRFALSAFGLRVPGVAPAGVATDDAVEPRIAAALLAFLATEPDALFWLESRKHVTVRRPLRHVDVAVLRFGGDGTLQGLDPHLASAGPAAPEPAAQARVHAAVIAAYNMTARLPEVRRPGALVEQVRQRLGPTGEEVDTYATRILSACCLSFEGVASDADARFCPPDFVSRRSLGLGYLSCVARADGQRGLVDLWVSAHHVGLDGVPLQDLLSRLEGAWGVEPVTFPAARSGAAFGPHACHAPGERAVDHLVTFVDLSPVLELRRDLTAQHAGAIGGEVTLGTLLAWLLSQEPEFAGVRIASTVDVKPSGGYDRDVDVVPLRPADFATGSGPWGGFIGFAREFNRLIAASRTRTSPLRIGMQTAGLLPPWAHATSVRSNPAALDDTFGSLCVTIIRDARVFVAPMTDLGLGHGFIAIGSATLPSADGRRVSSVSIKGDAGRVAHYPEILQRVIARAAAERGRPGFKAR